MNKELKFTVAAGASTTFNYGVGVKQIAITNYNGNEPGENIPVSKTIENAATAHFTDAASAPLLGLVVDIKAVQSGTGDPSPDNERPITGWTGANVIRAGKNLFDYNAISSIVVAQSEPHERNGMRFYKSGKYSVSCQNSGDYCYCRIFNADGTTKTTYNIVSNAVITPATFSISNGEYFVLYDAIGSNSVATSKQNFANWQAQVELSDNPTAYEPYNGNTYNISWQSTAGTVYGGTLDVKTGELKVTHANIASYDGETINEPWISSMDKYVAGATPTTGAQVVYPLTDPVTYQLTPVEVRSILGLNNVWADCGPVNVRYFVQSTQPMIDYVDDKTPVFFDAVEDLSTYDVSLVGATSTDIKNYLLANKNANIVIRVKRYSTILLYYLREYSPNYFAEFATPANVFDAEGTKSMRIDYLRLDLTQETSDFTDDYIILPAT